VVTTPQHSPYRKAQIRCEFSKPNCNYFMWTKLTPVVQEMWFGIVAWPNKWVKQVCQTPVSFLPAGTLTTLGSFPWALTQKRGALALSCGSGEKHNLTARNICIFFFQSCTLWNQIPWPGESKFKIMWQVLESRSLENSLESGFFFLLCRKLSGGLTALVLGRGSKAMVTSWGVLVLFANHSEIRSHPYTSLDTSLALSLVVISRWNKRGYPKKREDGHFHIQTQSCLLWLVIPIPSTSLTFLLTWFCNCSHLSLGAGRDVYWQTGLPIDRWCKWVWSVGQGHTGGSGRVWGTSQGPGRTGWWGRISLTRLPEATLWTGVLQTQFWELFLWE